MFSKTEELYIQLLDMYFSNCFNKMINYLTLDFFDNTRFIKLNTHNYEILNYICTNIDSSYRNIFNPDNEHSAWHIIRCYSHDGDWLKDPEKVSTVCKVIDKENSTHLSVSGFYERIGNMPNPGNARGIDQMTEHIVGHKGLLEKIKNGDGLRMSTTFF